MPMSRPELKNDVNIIGKLKSKYFEFEEDSGVDQNHVLKGNFVVVVGDDTEEVNELRIDFYSKRITNSGNESTQYKALETIKNEYKTIDEHGEEQADRVKVYGNLGTREYVSKGEYNKFNNIRFVSMTRDLKAEDPEYLNELVLQLVVGGYKDSDNENDKSMYGYTIGFKGRLNPVFDMSISNDIYEKVKNVYVPGATVTLVCELNNKVTTKVEEIEQELLFGDTTPEPRVIKSFDREIRVKSGFAPLKEGHEKFISEAQYKNILDERKRTVATFEAQIGNIPGVDQQVSNDDVPFMDDAPIF